MADMSTGTSELLDRFTRKWWVYLLWLLIFFLPAYAAKGYDPRATTDLIEAVLRAPLIGAVSPVYFILKLLPIAFVVLLLAFGNRIRRTFYGYVTLLFLAIAAFQNSGFTERYGLVVITSNVVYMTIAALAWLQALITGRGDFGEADPTPWKWPFFALAVFAFWFPVNETSVTPDFKPMYLVSNDSMVTACMAIPVVLAILLLYYPKVGYATLRITGFVGVVLGGINMLNWFALKPAYWWMGVLHLPLLINSALCFILSFASGRNWVPTKDATR